MWRSVVQGLTVGLILIVSFAPLQSGYYPPQSSSLLGEVTAFVADFGSWNATYHDLPLLIWEATPEDDKMEAFVWLFWLWLYTESSSNALPFSPLSSDNPVDASLGFIVLGQFGANPSTFPLNGGTDPPGLGDSNGSTWPPKNPLASTGNPSGYQSDSSPSGGSSGNLPSVPPVAPVPEPAAPVPEPAALTLLAAGGIELLIGYWIRRRFFAENRRQAVNSSPT